MSPSNFLCTQVQPISVTIVLCRGNAEVGVLCAGNFAVKQLPTSSRARLLRRSGRISISRTTSRLRRRRKSGEKISGRLSRDSPNISAQNCLIPTSSVYTPNLALGKSLIATTETMCGPQFFGVTCYGSRSIMLSALTCISRSPRPQSPPCVIVEVW